MEDKEILSLYFARDEAAISKTAEKYGGYLKSIAQRILHICEDADECVNDTYLKTWNAIPPYKPNVLRTFLGRIVRNIAINRARFLMAQKRGGGELPLILEELEQAAGGDMVEESAENRRLVQALNDFLSRLPEEQRRIFVRRYYFCESISDIAQFYGMTESKVKSALFRARGTLRKTLEREEIEI